MDWRFRAAQRLRHIVPEHPAQRCNQLRKAPEIDRPTRSERQDRLPLQEVPKQGFKARTVLRPNGQRAIYVDCASEAHQVANPLANSVERPFVAVGVEDVREVLKTA